MTDGPVRLSDWRVLQEDPGRLQADGWPDAEQALVGLVLFRPTAYQADLDPSHFREPAHRLLWRTMGELLREDPQLDSAALTSVLATRLRGELALNEFGGPSYLMLLYDKAPGEADARVLAGEVHRHGLARLEAALRAGDGAELNPSTAEWIEAERARLAGLWSPAGRMLRLVDPSAWEDDAVPAREWAWREYMPLGQATYLTGAGSAGKSLVAQQGATCAALGLPLLGVEMRQAVSLYVTCEDDMEELQRRQDAICYALQVRMSDLRGKLHLCSLVGEIGNELCLFDRDGRMATTPAWARLKATTLSLDAGFIGLDNVGHLFGGNEIVRAQVTAFCSLMNGLAVAGRKRSVLFLGHPNKAGDAYSGSTAWETAVRSRLYLSREEATKDAPVVDHDARTLSRGKANYAKKGGEIAFRWWRGAFVRDADLPAEEGSQLAAHLLTTGDEERFLACLAKATAEGRAASSSRNAGNFAPKLFATMPAAGGATRQRLNDAMDRLLAAGEIVDKVEVFRNAKRQIVMGLAPAQRSAQGSAQRLAQGCSSVHDDT